MGGFSAEREVSLVSGQGAAEALRSCGYEVVAHDLRDVREFIRVLEAEKPDAVFNALHGNWGEDGEIQGLLDLLQVPYTHSGLSASALGMDKFLTKEICRGLGIKVANGERMTVRAFRERATDLPMPYVVKPVSDGSSVGVFIVHSAADLEQVHYDDDGLEVLAERYVPGRELTCAVIGGKAYAVQNCARESSFMIITISIPPGRPSIFCRPRFPKTLPKPASVMPSGCIRLWAARRCRAVIFAIIPKTASSFWKSTPIRE